MRRALTMSLFVHLVQCRQQLEPLGKQFQRMTRQLQLEE
jgi:hypothetical protein